MAAIERVAWPARMRAQRRPAEIAVLQATRQARDTCRACEALLSLARDSAPDSVANTALADLGNTHLSLGEPNDA